MEPTGLPQYVPEPEVHPPLNFPDYRSTRLWAPARPLVALPQRLTEVTGPLLGEERVTARDADLTRQSDGEPIGQRILVSGQVRDSDGRPVPHSLIEIWQANAAGRYAHDSDTWQAPIDPHFAGVGRTVTGGHGRYRFTTVRPGADPWGNHHNAWRPAHIHFSLFGRAFTQRLVTQMYLPDDPMIAYDPIVLSVPHSSRGRLVSSFSMDDTRPKWALAYTWEIVLRGAPTHSVRRVTRMTTRSQTVGPFLSIALPWADGPDVVPGAAPGAFWLRGRVLDGSGEVVLDALVETWQADAHGRFCTS
jgi:protocatechuate 3,4-dioxygenase beta subunit